MTNEEKEILARKLTRTFFIFLRDFKNLAKQITSEMNYSKQHVEVMQYLKSHGKCKMTDIGKSMLVTKSYVTALVDKLDEFGYIYREHDVNDRRIILIGLTKKGDDVFKEYRDKFTQNIKERIDNVPEDKLSDLEEVLKLINKIGYENFIDIKEKGDK